MRCRARKSEMMSCSKKSLNSEYFSLMTSESQFVRLSTLDLNKFEHAVNNKVKMISFIDSVMALLREFTACKCRSKNNHKTDSAAPAQKW
jgi:hypothetical protein